MNNTISYVNKSLDRRKMTNDNNCRLTHQLLYHDVKKDVLLPPREKKTIDLDTLVAMIKLAEDEGYEIIQERPKKMIPEMEEEGAVTMVPNPIDTEEAPIVTSPEIVKNIKDPTGEERSTQNQEGTTLSDKSLIDHVTVKATPFVSPRAERTLNDQAIS